MSKRWTKRETEAVQGLHRTTKELLRVLEQYHKTFRPLTTTVRDAITECGAALYHLEHLHDAEVPPQPLSAGERYQTYGVDAAGSLVHAGVQVASGMTQTEADRLQEDWEKWRDAYLLEHPGDYPTRTDARPVVQLAMEPSGHPELRQWFAVKPATYCKCGRRVFPGSHQCSACLTLVACG